MILYSYILSPTDEIYCDHSVHNIDGGCSLKLIQNQIIVLYCYRIIES